MTGRSSLAGRPHSLVGKHPAPEGALRLKEENYDILIINVGKHPAPEGALRREKINTNDRPT